MASGHQKLDEAKKDPPWSLQRERGADDTLVSDFEPPEL